MDLRGIGSECGVDLCAEDMCDGGVNSVDGECLGAYLVADWDVGEEREGWWWSLGGISGAD